MPHIRDFVTELNAIDERVSSGPHEAHSRRYRALSEHERDLYDVNRFNFECICGGLGVFFTNSAGVHWRQTIDALGRIGARRAQRILKSACKLFPNGEPAADPDQFWQQANDSALQDKLNDLGHGIDDNELYAAMEAYWRKHISPPVTGAAQPARKPSKRANPQISAPKGAKETPARRK